MPDTDETLPDLDIAESSERRAWVRFPSGVTGSCQPLAAPTADRQEKAWAATVRDVSREGICLALSRRFEPGTVLIVEFAGSAGRVSQTQTVRVVRIAGKTQTGWAVACTFEVALSDVELRGLAPGAKWSESPVAAS